MTTRDVVANVIQAFNSQDSNVSSGSKSILSDAIKMLNKTLEEGQNSSESDLQQACDIIIVGAIIYAMAYDDSKYGIQEQFNHQYLYPIALGEENLQVAAPTFKSTIAEFGRLALIDKKLPFTGSINKQFFPALPDAIPAGHFDRYDLNKDQKTMDTKERSRLIKEAQDQRKWQNEEAEKKCNAYNKWARPFGWKYLSKNAFGFSGSGLDYLFSGGINQSVLDDIAKFNERKNKVIAAFKKQENEHNKKLWKRLGWTALAFVFLTPFSLFVTVPWLSRKAKKDAASFSQEPLQKRTFTIEAYEEIRQKRIAAKEAVKQAGLSRTPGEAKESQTGEAATKFKKVCIAYDDKGKETADRYAVKTVVMYCDKAQANRWDPGFFNYPLEAKAFVEKYDASKQNSRTLGQAEPFVTFRNNR